MEKKLPGVFANKVEKPVGNNKKVFYSSHNDVESAGVNSDAIDNRRTGSTLSAAIEKAKSAGTPNINQKINSIFNSSNYIYKADVVLTTRDGKISKRIVGKNSIHLITMENELIPISEIIDIEIK